MNSKTLFILIFVSVFSTACLFDSMEVKNDEPSKIEIEKRKENGDTKDYCEIFNWYDDGTCDDFCIKEDSDCAVQCGAIPVCPSGTIEVPECLDQADCEGSSMCGTTIYCVPVNCDDADGLQVCGPGYYLSNECESIDPERQCIELLSECLDTMYCNPDPIVACLAVPVVPPCADGAFPVEHCQLSDTECNEITVCHETIACAPALDCDAVVRCEEDEIGYASREECERGGGPCRQHYLCSSVIWCGANANCSAPSCGMRPKAPNCEDPEKCIEIVGCGEGIICEI